MSSNLQQAPIAAGSAGFCTCCSAALARRVPVDDVRERLVCTRCDRVHYENPKVLVTCVVTCGRSVLLCRRALQPAYGLWAPPSGFLEEGETLQEAAARETFEETGVVIDAEHLALRGVITLTALRQVYVGFRARVAVRHCVAGREAIEAGFFSEQDVPWPQIAYPEIAADLRAFFSELATGQHRMHVSSVG